MATSTLAGGAATLGCDECCECEKHAGFALRKFGAVMLCRRPVVVALLVKAVCRAYLVVSTWSGNGTRYGESTLPCAGTLGEWEVRHSG